MKIGIIMDTSLDLNDGVQQYVMAMGEWLRSAGHDVHYLVGETNERALPNIHSLCRNINVRFNGNRISIPLWADRRKVKQLLAAEDFDVLYVTTPHHPLMAQYIITHASARTAVVGIFHILPYNWFAKVSNRLLSVLLRPSLRRIDQMFAVSSSAKDFAEWSFNLPSGVSPNVIEYSRFADAKPFEKYTDNTLTILFLGRLVERKGCRYLLEAVAQLDRTKLPKFRVVICGKGELLDDLQKYTKQIGIEDIVEFTGFVTEEDKPRYYASADLSVFPSTSGESFGIVLLEAMASGNAAVLAGDNPGYATVMEPRPELLFNPKDTGKLAAMLTEYLTNDQKRKKVATWGKAYTAKFDIEVVGPQLVEIFEKIIAKRQQTQDNTK